MGCETRGGRVSAIGGVIFQSLPSPPTRTAARSIAAVDRVPDPPCHVGMVAASRP